MKKIMGVSMQRPFIPTDEPLNRISTIIQFHLRQTPAKLTATSSPSEENI